jgi:nucleoside-diphosphate-sugar epimerase
MILVSGGSGVMGSRLVRGLVNSGWRVRAMTLPNDPLVSRLDGVSCEVFYGDISDAASLKGAFDGIDTVYHLAAIIIADNPALFETINVTGTRNMVEGAIAAGVKHFILVSSASVVYPKTTSYSISKRECERIVKEQSSVNYTIVRPTLAYEENGGQEFMMFMDYLKKYPIVPFIGRGRSRKSPVHVDDLMRGFLALAGNEKSFGKTYNFSGGEEISIWELAQLMLKHQGLQKRFVPIPVSACKVFSTIMEKTMKRPPLTWNAIAGAIQDGNLDHSSATEDLGYNPIGVREGLQKCFPLAHVGDSHQSAVGRVSGYNR